jgi:hypothetical protein
MRTWTGLPPPCRLQPARTGTERNEVQNPEVVRVQVSESDPYAPADDGPAADGVTDFPFGANGG